MKKILLGADHAGFALKEALKPSLQQYGFKIEDITPVFTPDDDYPPIGKKVAKKIVQEKTQGLLICGSGYGMDIAANRIKGARASVCHSPDDARRAREDDHSNILILGGRVTTPVQAKKILEVWIHTKPKTATRFIKRIKMLDT